MSHSKDKILDALESLLINKNIQSISVNEIAQAAGMGKSSIYYYFPSKEAILEALIQRNYEFPLKTAKDLATQKNISPFTRMAMLFQACKSFSYNLLNQDSFSLSSSAQENAYIHQKYMSYLIVNLKPFLTEIIQQGIDCGEIHFSSADALAEIVLIILAVKFDNSLVPSKPEEIAKTLYAMITLLEKGTENPVGSLDFLKVL